MISELRFHSARRSRLPILPFVASAVIGISAPAGAQPAAVPPSPTPARAPVEERVRVSLVQIPVTVENRDGRPVMGLTLADFQVWDEGKPVRLAAVDEIEYPGPPPPDADDVSTVRVSSAAALRKFLLLFDLTFSSPSELQRTFKAAEQFVRQRMGQLDVVGVATVSAGNGVKLLQTFTPDRARLAEVLSEAGSSDEWEREKPPSDGASTAIRSDIRASLSQDHDRYRRQLASRLIGHLQGVSVGLEPMPGRKFVLLFSHGFDPQLLNGDVTIPSGPRDLKQTPFGDTDTFGDSGLREELDRMHQSFRRHDSVIYCIDLGGIGANLAETANQQVGFFGRNRESLAAIARGTGGIMLSDSNDYAPLLDRILEQTRTAYLLNFPPAATGQPGRFHALKVKVGRRGARRVFVREGYFEPASR